MSPDQTTVPDALAAPETCPDCYGSGVQRHSSGGELCPTCKGGEVRRRKARARREAIRGLRAMADLMERHPGLPVPSVTGCHLPADEFASAIATGLFAEIEDSGNYVHAHWAEDNKLYRIQADAREYRDIIIGAQHVDDFWDAYDQISVPPTLTEIRDMALRYGLDAEQIQAVMAKVGGRVPA